MNVLQKIILMQNTELSALPTQKKKSPDFFPVLNPQEDGIFFITIFHTQSLRMQERFSTKERLTFQIVPWKMFHIVSSLTHRTDVSACLCKALEQSWQQSYPANSLTPNSSILIMLSCIWHGVTVTHLHKGNFQERNWVTLIHEKSSLKW